VEEIAHLYRVTTPQEVASGLVGYWSFNGKDTKWTSSSAGTVTDLSGKGNTGTLTSMSQSTSPTPGKIGQALKFDGSTNYIDIPASGSLSLGTSMTVSIWFNRQATTANQALVTSNKYYTAGFNGNWLLRVTSGSALAFASYDGQSNEEWKEFAFTINNNVWNHAVVSINGTTATMYLNGVASVSGTLNHTKALINAGVSGMRIGDDLAWANVFFNGSIDDVRMYNRALSADEVAAFYNAGR
ncbi:MAG: LamG domain-containing protein, partial [bacterium]|nr:LamG domain-containing protein [bacterium]